MALSGITIHVPVSIVFDNAKTSSDASVEDFYRALEEADQAGFLDRRLINISYGDPIERTPFTPEGDYAV